VERSVLGKNDLSGSLVLESIDMSDLLSGLTLGEENSLDGVAGKNTADGRLEDDWSRKIVARLLLRSFLRSAEDIIELLESLLRPDEKSARMAAGAEINKTETVNISNLNAGDVPEAEIAPGTIANNDHWANTACIAAISGLALASSDSLAVLHPFNFVLKTNSLEELLSLLGADDLLNV